MLSEKRLLNQRKICINSTITFQNLNKGVKSFISFVGHTAHCGTESEHQVLSGSHIFTQMLVLFGTKFQYSRKRRQDDEGEQFR